MSNVVASKVEADINQNDVNEADIRQADVSTEGVGNADAPAVENQVVENESDDQDGLDDGEDQFSRGYVEKLRKESKKYRERARMADEYAHRLVDALVRLDGRLADPKDLEFKDEFLEDEGKLETAITELITVKPGLRARRFSGDVGAGSRGSATGEAPDLIQFMQGIL